ncbi:M15 family metallopeptidase [Solirubrobacter phytolaccae]|uniref:M15 family metallopeptidase n=1 Tax=Solirubrobacter phytolaccae TaxID=1404360 RepID=A0A9X3NKU3_9ACTN|nr:M15 family metallopeptidase [Solirubrobacter phytolaccae]MDA0183267.1 M15 family metallopeptidase [Solirubrobacter phytolaccae]
MRIRRRRLVGLLVVAAAIAAALGRQSPESSLPTVPTISAAPSASTVTPSPQLALPGTDNLDAELLAALQHAAAEAADDGVELVVDSGWRSPEHQQQLLDEAVVKYGSAAEAARWVATPGRSAHVSGDAVDMATAGAKWLSLYGADFGLCQIYANEPWHYELRPDAAEYGCPGMYADPTQDPRMHR